MSEASVLPCAGTRLMCTAAALSKTGETIGARAPFVLDGGDSTITAHRKAHQAFGAWIAKSGH